ncbi:hypothetical protein [Psychromonas sp. MME2]|uniref:hypothetical protein n=1 Tax=unclassified Psychromonas TaxID=2614957 RepID=UPI00339BBDA8
MTEIQNQGRPKLSNTQRIQAQLWYCELSHLAKAKNTNDLAKKIELGRPDALYKAKNGKGAPDETTQKLVALKFPQLIDYYNCGPFNMIRIMNQGRLKDACKLIQDQLIKLLLAQDIYITETPFVHDAGPLYTWLTDLGLNLYQRKEAYGLNNDIIPLVFAISYCEYKLLDSKKSLSSLIHTFLDHFESKFNINPNLWKSDINIIEVLKYAETYNMWNDLIVKTKTIDG